MLWAPRVLPTQHISHFLEERSERLKFKRKKHSFNSEQMNSLFLPLNQTSAGGTTPSLDWFVCDYCVFNCLNVAAVGSFAAKKAKPILRH